MVITTLFQIIPSIRYSYFWLVKLSSFAFTLLLERTPYKKKNT